MLNSVHAFEKQTLVKIAWAPLIDPTLTLVI